MEGIKQWLLFPYASFFLLLLMFIGEERDFLLDDSVRGWPIWHQSRRGGQRGSLQHPGQEPSGTGLWGIEGDQLHDCGQRSRSQRSQNHQRAHHYSYSWRQRSHTSIHSTVVHGRLRYYIVTIYPKIAAETNCLSSIPIWLYRF